MQETPFEESNLFLFGSDLEYNIKKSAAEKEPEWNKISTVAGVLVWRIEKFNVVSWPTNLYGSFYDGDSYIVLITKVTETGAIEREAHMWIGNKTTADESGTAAYKVVELDDFFERHITLIWNSQGQETKNLRSAFGTIRIMQGGISSGFKHFTKEIKVSELFEIVQDKVHQVDLTADSLTSQDSFVLDSEDVIYLWRGKNSNHREKFNAARLVTDLKKNRSKVKFIDINEGEEDENFWNLLGGKKEIKNNSFLEKKTKNIVKVMYVISDKTGEIKMDLVEYGKKSLISDDVFLIHSNEKIFLWIGKNANGKEKIECMKFAQKFVKDNNLQRTIKIFFINEDHEPFYFEKLFV